MIERPLISIIVPSFSIGRLKDVMALLNSIKAQTYPNIETIIVIGSSMMLLRELQDYAGKNDESGLKIIFNDEPGATSARNLGINQSTGEYLAFIDDDAVLSPGWAAELVKTYQDRSVVGVTGLILPLWADRPENWFPGELDWIIGCSRWIESDQTMEIRNVMGANASFRRDVLTLAGFYSTVLGARKSEQSEWGVIAEEAELSLRVIQKTGGTILYNPGLIVHHRVSAYKLSWEFIAQRSFQVGRTRRMIKSLSRGVKQDANILSIEHALLKRILTRVIPGTFLGFFRNPVNAWRRLAVTVSALFFVALGYFAYFLAPTGARPKLLVEPKGVEDNYAQIEE
jgi:cellulose synthase/poly-beta-1,6-N-acetylglucosamine synthase-like glycosyltransferase